MPHNCVNKEANKLLKKEAISTESMMLMSDSTKILKKKYLCCRIVGHRIIIMSNVIKLKTVFQSFFKIGDVATKCFAPPLFKHIYLDKDNGRIP